MKKMDKMHVNTELLIDLVQGALEEEGYETKRYSDGNTMETTEYDRIIAKGIDGNYYELGVCELKERRCPYTGKIYKPEEAFEKADKWR